MITCGTTGREMMEGYNLPDYDKPEIKVVALVDIGGTPGAYFGRNGSPLSTPPPTATRRSALYFAGEILTGRCGTGNPYNRNKFYPTGEDFYIYREMDLREVWRYLHPLELLADVAEDE